MLVNNRYEIKDTLGQGGMGIVYRAYDLATKRDVALKTLRDTDQTALELFSKEWTVLAGISHPNIVDILDCGEFTHKGERKPFFVMPLLPGKTLDQIIRGSVERLTVERTIEILVQTCRGLQAAHDRGLIHRDLKPSNIFVMEDDTAKIIDFGVVHSAGSHSVTGIKGTLQYMAPEQIMLKPVTPLVDIFSLAVVSYEALTARKPFFRKTEGETADAVLNHVPPAASELNPAVTDLVSRVIHKAMAKDPRHRFASARELAETLQRALRNQPIEKFDPASIQPRIARAKNAFNEGDTQFANDILSELEAEGNVDPAMSVLRLQITQASRQRTIRQLLEDAQIRFEQEEHPLALHKLQQVLQIDPENSEALRMRKEIESRRSERQIDNWVRLAQEHLERGAFSEARRGLQEALKLKPDSSKVNRLLAELSLQEQETSAARSQKEKLYNSAKEAFQKGELSIALASLERVLDLNRKTPDRTSPDKDALYQSLYNQVHSEHDACLSAYDQARRHLSEKNFAKALQICEEYQTKYPNQALFQALKLEIGEQERQEFSSYTAEVAKRLDQEPDLDRKLSVIKDAAARYPHEPQFQQSLKLIRERRDLVVSIVEKARKYEERGQFAEAIGQWDILRSIYPQYPALAFEVEQLQRRREQQKREEEKSRLVEQIDRALELADYERAGTLARKGLTDYAGDAELSELERMAIQGRERSQQAQKLLDEARKSGLPGKFEERIETLRRALELDPRSTSARTALAAALTDRAYDELLKDDWSAAEALIQEALELDPNHESAKSLKSSVQDHRRKEVVSTCLAKARELQGKGDFSGAMASVEQCLRNFPNEGRLLQLRANLQQQASEAENRKPAKAHPKPNPKADRNADLIPTVLFAPPAPEPLADPVVPPAVKPIAATLLFAPSDLPADVEPEAVPAHPPGPSPPREPDVATSQGAKRRLSPAQLGGLAAVPLLIAGGWVITHFRARPATTPAPAVVAGDAKYPIIVQTKPSGALIKVDGNPATGSPVNLIQGPHTIEASLPGYASLSRKVNVGPNLQPIQFALIPELQRLRLTTSLASAKVLLDGKPAGDLQGGMFSKDDVGWGEHSLQVMNGRREVLAVRFKSSSAAPAEILPPIKTPELLVISSFGDRAKIFSGPTAFRFALKDQPPQPVPAEGLNVVRSGAASELVATDGKNQHALPLDSGNAPTISIYLNDAADTRPTLLIGSNVEGAQVFVNGKAQNWRLYRGRFAGRVEPGTYTIKVSKPGYMETAEQTIKVNTGDTKTLQFALSAVPTKSTLVIAGGTPGAEVSIDQISKGHLDAGGNFSIDVPAGAHDILVTKDLYEPGELKRTAKAGEELRIAGAEARLKPFGTLNFQVGTPGAEISYRREDESQSHSARNDESVRVKEGRYQISISIGKLDHREELVTVTAGKATTVTGPVIAKTEPKPDIPVQREQSPFVTPAAWEQDENGYWVIRSGYGWIARSSGEFRVDLLRKSRKLFGGTNEWVIAYRNRGKDKVGYKLNNDGVLTRSVTVQGRTTDVKLAQRVTTGDAFRLHIVIEPTRILIRDVDNTKVDEYTDPDADFTAGNFGFNKGVHLKITR